MLLFCLWISRLCLLLSLSKSRVYEIWYSCNILFTCLCKLFEGLFCLYPFLKSRFCWICLLLILEDPGADSGGAILTSDWCKKTFVIFCLIRRQNGGDRLELVWSDIVPRGSSCHSLLFFMPCFSARLDFPSPPLSTPGSPRMHSTHFLIISVSTKTKEIEL